MRAHGCHDHAGLHALDLDGGPTDCPTSLRYSRVLAERVAMFVRRATKPAERHYGGLRRPRPR